MAVRIRLRRTGKRNAPAHRIVVTDKRNPRDGNFIECIGTYDPRHSVEKVDIERADHWISRGAQPSETVSAIIKRGRAGVTLADQKKKVEGKTFKHASQQQKPKTRAAKPAEEEAPAAEAEETGADTEGTAAEKAETAEESTGETATETENEQA